MCAAAAITTPVIIFIVYTHMYIKTRTAEVRKVHMSWERTPAMIKTNDILSTPSSSPKRGDKLWAWAEEQWAGAPIYMCRYLYAKHFGWIIFCRFIVHTAFCFCRQWNDLFWMWAPQQQHTTTHHIVTFLKVVSVVLHALCCCVYIN